MTVNLPIEFKSPDGSTSTIVLKYINPNVDDEVLRRFVNTLFSLTNNQLVRVFKEIEKFLSEIDGEFVTAEELDAILSGTFQRIPDDDPIPAADIQSIVDGNYSPVPDDDPPDYNFIF